MHIIYLTLTPYYEHDNMNNHEFTQFQAVTDRVLICYYFSIISKYINEITNILKNIKLVIHTTKNIITLLIIESFIIELRVINSSPKIPGIKDKTRHPIRGMFKNKVLGITIKS